MNKILIFCSAVVLSACASNTTVTSNSSSTSTATEVKPSYAEKVTATDLQSFKTSQSCPGDKKWQGWDWKKIIGVANACVKAGQWNRVEEVGNHLAVQAHLTPWGPYYLSLAAESRQDYPRATWMLELALKKAPKEGLFHYQLGRLWWRQGEDASALKELKQASEMNPSLCEAHYVMGQIALQSENYSEAERLFKKALAVNQRHADSQTALAFIYMRSKEWAKAEAALARALELDPRNLKVKSALAQVQASNRKPSSESQVTK